MYSSYVKRIIEELKKKSNKFLIAAINALNYQLIPWWRYIEKTAALCRMKTVSLWFSSSCSGIREEKFQRFLLA